LGTNIKKELLRFVSEDIQSGDVTSVLLPKKKIKAKIISREDGILAGVRFAREIFRLKGCHTRVTKKDGAKIKPNQVILEVSGDAKAVLSCERTVLNLLARMSGIATQTSLLVSKIRKINRKTKLYSTRKTAPCLRFFDKEAVAIGGGFVKYGEIMTKLDVLSEQSGPDLTPLAQQIGNNQKMISENMNGISDNAKSNAVLEKEIELLKLQLEEIKVNTSNPLTSNSGN